jgi:hypothetical protein
VTEVARGESFIKVANVSIKVANDNVSIVKTMDHLIFQHPSFPFDVEIKWFKDSASGDVDAVRIIDDHAMTPKGRAMLAMVRGW